MPAAAAPPNELLRVATLHDYRLLDTGPDEVIDTLVRCVKRVMRMPLAAVSLVDTHRQWMKSRAGFDFPETSREVSFCSHGLGDGAVMAVGNAVEDPRFYDNPLVQSGMIGSYFGAPLIAPNGMALGMLCAAGPDVDISPTSDQLECLVDLAGLVMHHFELHRLGCALRSEMTRVTEATGRAHRMNARMEEILDARADFFGTLAEDLRKPLRGLLGVNYLAQTGAPGGAGEMAAFADRVRSVAGQMQESIDDALQLTIGWRCGKQMRSVVEVNPLLDEVIGLTQAFAEARSVTVSVTAKPLAAFVSFDRECLRNALLELVVNAIRACSGEGFVMMSVLQPGASWIVVEVFNTGAPLGAADAARALTPLGQPCEFGGEGSGVRLPISRMLTEKFGGELTLQGVPERGGTAARIRMTAANPSVASRQRPSHDRVVN